MPLRNTACDLTGAQDAMINQKTCEGDEWTSGHWTGRSLSENVEQRQSNTISHHLARHDGGVGRYSQRQKLRSLQNSMTRMDDGSKGDRLKLMIVWCQSLSHVRWKDLSDAE